VDTRAFPNETPQYLALPAQDLAAVRLSRIGRYGEELMPTTANLAFKGLECAMPEPSWNTPARLNGLRPKSWKKRADARAQVHDAPRYLFVLLARSGCTSRAPLAS